jgi:hypothetical protein
MASALDISDQSLLLSSFSVGTIFDSVSRRPRPSVKIRNCDGGNLPGTKIARTARGRMDRRHWAPATN